MKMAARLITGLAAMALCAGAAEAQMLQIKGSDTVINLVQRMAEIYMQKNPGKQIAVTGGGTGTGIAALINGKCDVANASRTMKQSEVASAMANGVDPVRIVIGMDGVSVIVNGSNTVDQLTMDQLGKIFRGEVTNWSEVGGKNMPITLYGRQPNSGTFGFFMEVVLKGDYSPKMNQMNGNAQIVEAVKSDPSGIGYVGVGYAKTATGIVVLKVARSSSGPFASPLNAAEVNSGAYPIARPLNQYVSGAPKGAVKDFIAFELGPEGQKLVEEEGFFPLPDEYATYNQKAGF